MPDFNIDVIKIFTLGTLSFGISFLMTPILTNLLYKHKFWRKKKKTKATDGGEIPIFNKYHGDDEKKTPRGGGFLIWITCLILALLFLGLSKLDFFWFQKLNFLSREQTWLLLFALVAGSLLGFIEDLVTIRGTGKYLAGGLKLKHRLFLVSIIGIIGALWFYFKLDWQTINVPGIGDLNIGIWYILLFVIVNLAVYSSEVIDGIDGLSGGTFSSIFAAYGIIALWRGQIDIAAFCAVILGSLLSFLWFNIPPARFYMGETGILGLGTSLTVVAFLTDSVLVLPIIGFLLVATTASDIIQLASKKYRKKKVFLAAPLHHHFEGKGWPGYKVTMRYWVVGIVMAFIGVTIRLLG